MYQGWKVVAAGFVIAAVAWFVGFYGPSVYLVALGERHGWSVSMISTAITAYYVCSAVLTSFAAELYLRLHPAALVTAASLALGAGLALLGVIDQPWQLYPAFGLIVLGWSVTGGAGVYAIVGPWFDRRRGLALSIALTGASFAGVITAPVWTALLPHFGFAEASRLAAAGCIALLIPVAWLFLRRLPEGGVPEHERRADKSAAAPSRGVPTRRALFLMPYFWTISGPFALGLFVQVGLLTHQLALLTPQLGPARAASCVAVTGAMAIAGRLLVGAVVDRFDVRLASALVFVVQAAGLVTLWSASGFAGLMVGCVLFGFGVGNLITLPSLIVHREYNAAAFTRVVGLLIAINQLTFAFGPGFLGYMRTFFGSYDVALLLCAAAQVLCAAVVLIRPPVTPPSR